MVVWVALGMFGLVVRLALGVEFWQAVALSVVQILVSLVLSTGMRQVLRQPGMRPFRMVTVAWLLGSSALAAVILASVTQGVEMAAGWKSPDLSLHDQAVLRLALGWIAFLAWSLGYLGMKAEIDARAHWELARLARDEARRIELQMLRAQLDPHFLFNSLNSIATEIDPHPLNAREMILGLSDYLRYSLEHRNRPTGSLAAELDAVMAYLAIQRARFADRLVTEVDADTAARRRTVPSFLLQPLVENAVKHGFDADLASWNLRVHARVAADNTLRIDVSNSGRLDAPRREGGGVGLETLRKRLNLHYPGRHRFSLEQSGSDVFARLELEGDPCFA